MCRTAMNYSQKIGKPSIGVFLSDIEKDSWEHTMSPQNKILATSTTEIVPKVLSVTYQHLARVQLPTPDRSVERAIVEKFQKFAAACRVGELFNEGNFFGSVFDSDGGYLKIPNKDVILTIPPGAVEDGKRQPVYCNVTAYKYGEIHPGKVILTPLVHCGPDGAKFNKDVLLSFPHSAVDENSWNFTAMTKSGESKWESWGK
ncbi:netrin receptor UNC5B-a-like isoform X2 [Ptychodera flava]|uniref:netrin receptor UNC5B-a-like isoform X2 n=1 Tax=Ptychodera flava TaxID=63121 RepID=UPI00396A1BC8